MEQYTFTGNAELLLEYVNSTNKNIFLTGKAGTGKTTLLRHLEQNTHKNTAIAAPTGIAAINAGGVTLHSLLQLPFGIFVPDEAEAQNLMSQSDRVNGPRNVRSNMKMGAPKRTLLRELELLVIDEVSMLRADLTDCIDTVLRSVRRNRNVPFGGLQILFIGDLNQLPPVITRNEKDIYERFYDSSFFFASRVLKEHPPVYVELEKIYRQKDEKFLNLLNKLRNNQLTGDDIEVLNQNYKPGFDLSKNKDYIYVTTHNYKADRINNEALKNLEGKVYKFEAEVEDDFPESMFPVPRIAEFKKGAKVMFVTNDPTGQKRFFNGKIGFITALGEDRIEVRFEGSDQKIDVEKYEWRNTRYKFNKDKDEMSELVKGTFTHFPLKLAHAVTVHKSQGLTFEKAVLDLSGSFAPGQMYVALSRLTSLDGLVLSEPVPDKKFNPEEGVLEFNKNKREKSELKEGLKGDKRQYLNDLLMRAFEFNELYFAFSNHLREFNKDESKSKRMTFYEWTTERNKEVDEFRATGKKFLKVAFGKQLEDESYYAFLKERTTGAMDYYKPKLNQLHAALKNQYSRVKKGDGLKAYAKELKEIIILPVRAQKTIAKAALTAKCFSEGTYPDLSKLEEAQPEEVKASKKAEKPAKKKKQLPKGETYAITLKLYKSGLNAAEIAEKRGMAASTIEGHLARFVSNGELKVDQLLSDDKIKTIEQAFRDVEEGSLTAVKKQLGDGFSYGELNLVAAHLSWKALQNT